MVETLQSAAVPMEAPPSLDSAAHEALAAGDTDCADQIPQREAGSDEEPGRFFRGFVIFLGIAALFWLAVVWLIRMI